MKIKFRVSEVTTLDPAIINGLILLKLKDKKYEALEVTENTIKFYDDPWVMRWRHEQTRRLDGGDFTIDKINNQTSVTLNYYLNLLPPLITLSIPVVGTIIVGAYEGTIFFLVFITIALCVQTIISKNVARDMLTAILSEDVMK